MPQASGSVLESVSASGLESVLGLGLESVLGLESELESQLELESELESVLGSESVLDLWWQSPCLNSRSHRPNSKHGLDKSTWSTG